MKAAGLIVFVALSLVISTVPFVAGGLEDSLKHWETLSMSSIKRRIVKRDVTSRHPVEEQVNFRSYGRHFSLILRKDFSVLAPGFNIRVFEADGRSQEAHLDLNIYKGIVQGEENSSVSAYWNDNHALSASIQTDSELYFVEPAVNLNPNATNETLVIYRESDLRWDNNSAFAVRMVVNKGYDKLNRCGYVNGGSKQLKPISDQLRFNETQSSRSKRDSCKNTDKNSCYLYLAADPDFYQHVGRSDIRETANRMLQVIARVDGIYRRHQFEGCDKGFGFEIQKIHIFPQPTAGYSFTADKQFTYDDFLTDFTSDPALKTVCLGHLFTYKPFDDGGYVLGLAYMGSPDPDSSGGICSGDDSTNSGWTTYIGSYPVPALQAMSVTAHEFGHNWGSPHDSDKPPGCIHPASEGGNYIVYPIAVSGRDQNNDKFSPCSIRAMGAVLSAKASQCFQVRGIAECGNYRVDPPLEECDSGLIVSTDGDSCCDSNCKLRPPAVCSDWSDLCCLDCQIKTEAKANEKGQSLTCYVSTADVCLLNSKCDGKNRSCPQSDIKPNGEPCTYWGSVGKCTDGSCQGLCSLNGLEPCSCDRVADSCKLCCRDLKGACSPLFVDGHIEYLPPGMSCVIGACDDEGKCSELLKDVIMRLWEILDIASPSGFVRFMKNNVVWTILIMSLFVWVPISCLACAADRKAQKERDALIFEVVEETIEEEDTSPSQTSIEPVGRVATQREEVKSDSATPTPPAPIVPLGGPAQRSKATDDVKPGSATPPAEPVKKSTRQHKTKDAGQPDSTTPSEASMEPLGKQAQRRATIKYEIRETVRGIANPTEPSPAEDPTAGNKVWSWLNPNSAKIQ